MSSTPSEPDPVQTDLEVDLALSLTLLYWHTLKPSDQQRISLHFERRLKAIIAQDWPLFDGRPLLLPQVLRALLEIFKADDSHASPS